MDAISLLKADHKKVEGLFKQVAELGDRAHQSRAKLFEKIDQELTVHAKIEETIFYPALKAKTKRNTEPSDEVFEAYEEHANVKAMIGKLEGLAPSDETYNAKLQVLMELVKHHVKEEETEMFKQARQLLSESDLKKLGEQMIEAKSKIGV
jgi:hemerythrin superfamily protein